MQKFLATNMFGKNIQLGGTYSTKELLLVSNIEETVKTNYAPRSRHFLVKVEGETSTIIKEITREEIDNFVKDKSKTISKMFLGRFSTNNLLLEELASSEDVSLRKSVAGNVNTPIYILKKLSKDEDKKVRALVAANICLPTHLKDTLIKDSKSEVVWGAIENPNTTIKELENFKTMREFDSFSLGLIEKRIKNIKKGNITFIDVSA